MPKPLPLKELFDLPEGIIYLDGNSLGPLPKCVPARVADTVRNEWGELLIKGWNQAGWMAGPGRVGDKVGALIGAQAGSVVTGDTLSIKVYQALAAALAMRPDRSVILSESGNFPTDLYMAEGLIHTIGKNHTLQTVAPDEILGSLAEDTAVVMLTQVDYRTGRLHDMKEITKAVHEAGAVMLWDLAHSAGALPVDLEGAQCEFAVGCTYKYLNGGPGAPAFIYVRPDLIADIEPSLAGWLGHDAPFSFEESYRPAQTIERMRVGTPPVLQMAALDAALSVWQEVSMDEVRTASLSLSNLFIRLVEERCPQLALASPRKDSERGSQVSFAFEHGYAAIQALIDRGVIGDFRAPNIMRFGFTPLYLDAGDITKAVEILANVLEDEIWKLPKYQIRQTVT